MYPVSGYVGMTFAAITTILRLTLRIRYFSWDDVFVKNQATKAAMSERSQQVLVW